MALIMHSWIFLFFPFFLLYCVPTFCPSFQSLPFLLFFFFLFICLFILSFFLSLSFFPFYLIYTFSLPYRSTSSLSLSFISDFFLAIFLSLTLTLSFFFLSFSPLYIHTSWRIRMDKDILLNLLWWKDGVLLSLVVFPLPRHLLAPTHQHVQVNVPGGIDVVLGSLAILEKRIRSNCY